MNSIILTEGGRARRGSDPGGDCDGAAAAAAAAAAVDDGRCDADIAACRCFTASSIRRRISARSLSLNKCVTRDNCCERQEGCLKMAAMRNATITWARRLTIERTRGARRSRGEHVTAAAAAAGAALRVPAVLAAAAAALRTAGLGRGRWRRARQDG